MCREVPRTVLAAGLLALLVPFPGGALEPKKPYRGLDQQEFFEPDLYISSSHARLDELLDALPNRAAWEAYLAGRALRGEPPVEAYIDPRSGAATNLVGAFPLIPGKGAGNQVTLEQLGARIGRPVEAVDAAVVADAVRAFVRENQAILGVDPAQLGAARSVQVNPHLWQVSLPQVYRGLPVRHGRLAASISHGNLVVIGAETWGAVVGLPAQPAIGAAAAVTAGFDYAGGRTESDEIVRQPALEVVPVAPREHQAGEAFGGPVGAGYRHRLVWSFLFRRRPANPLWEVLVDARDGTVLAFQDLNQYADRALKGAVYPLTSTEICPDAATCGTMQSAWPMPFADTGLPPPHEYTNGAGVFDFPGGTATTTLNGRYVRIVDVCGPASASSTFGSIDLGGANGQHDCASPGGSPGNTASSRSAFYEINKIAEMARGWLPSNAWLSAQLPTVVNINDTCNAFYDFTGINFYRSGGGCRNTGEIAQVFDHEWGHGLDDHDAAGELSNSSEAYADIAAIYRLQTSCLGHGFFWTLDQGCGQTADGTGFNVDESQNGTPHCALDCSGVRDADWDKHADHAPDTALGFVCDSCFFGSGPCGRQVHCAAAPSRQAAWDLVTRDLQAPPFDYDSQTAFMIGNKLFYHGSGNIGEWHACACGDSSSGCGATNAYMQWLTADDDNGDLSDGTPHMTAIFNAFDRHGIACSTPAPQNGGCAAGPSAGPALAVDPGVLHASLSWDSVPAAEKYWVFRTEGHAGCDFGKTKIAETHALAHVDSQVAAGRSYSYNVVAVGSSPSCFGPVSNCVTVVPEAGVVEPCFALTLSHTGPGGDPAAFPDHSADCPSGQYHAGEFVQLTASPDAGFVVSGWTGTDDDGLFTNQNAVTMPAAGHAVSVSYALAEVAAEFDFETDPGLVMTGLWHRTTACEAASPGHSVPTVLYYGVDAQCDFDAGTTAGTATLPAFSLDGLTPPITLRFNYFLSTEGTLSFDAATVEVSSDGGPFTVLMDNQFAPAQLDDPSGGWKSAIVDLSPYVDTSVELRFSFATGDSILNFFPGFYVDDVLVNSADFCELAPDLVLSDQTITTAALFEACDTITAGPNFVVGAGGDVTFSAGDRVALASGFRVLSGGKLTVVVP